MKTRFTQIKKIKTVLVVVIAVIFGYGNAQAYNVADNHSNIYVDVAVANLLPHVKQVQTNENVLQLFSHGQAGQLLLNGTWLDAQQIGEFLQSHVNLENVQHLNIYSCEFAKGEKGKAAVAFLQKELGIDIAASTNITGVAGDWNLEVGNINNALQLNDYQHNLQCAGTVGGTLAADDYDGDGACNDVDLDDDNDGILDTQECPSDLQLVRHAGVQLGSTMSGVLISNGRYATITGSATAGASFSTSLAATWIPFREDLSGTLTFSSDEPLNTLQVFVDHLNYINLVGNFTATLSDGTVISDLPFTIEASYGIFVPPGAIRDFLTLTAGPLGSNYVRRLNSGGTDGGAGRLTFPSLTSEYLRSKGGLVSIAFDVVDQAGDGPTASFIMAGSVCKDTDGDGTPNYLDLDSDDDGCPDALEGAAGFLFADLDTDNSLGDTVGSTPGINEGVPTAVGTGQADVSSANGGVQSTECACNGGIDTDGDGVNDACDLDDDNDGLLDTVEGCTLIDGLGIENYTAFGIVNIGNRSAALFGWTSIPGAPVALATDIIPGNDANHLATDYDRDRVIFTNNGTQGSIFAYYFSGPNANTVVNIGNGFMSPLGTTSGGASFYNGNYYIFDDEFTTSGTNPRGVFEITFDAAGDAQTLTKIADVGNFSSTILPNELGDIAISADGILYA